MKVRSIFVSLLLLFPVALLCKPALNIQHWQIKNGAQAYFVRTTELPMVDIRIAFMAGSALDGRLPGLAALTNTLLVDGAANFSADQIATQFDNVGAIYTKDVERTMASIGLRSLTIPKYLPSALRIFSLVLNKPTFPLKQFKRERNAALGELAKREQFPDAVAQRAFYKALYGRSPLAHLPLGTQAGVKKITLSAIKRFYRNYYVGRNALIAIVGDLSLNQAKKIANQTVGLLPAGKPAPKLPAVPDTVRAKTINIPFPSEQTNIYLGQVGIARNNPDYFSLKVGNYILGGGMTSLLFNNVRAKKGLAYSIYSAFLPNLVRGPFLINLQSRNDQAKEGIRIVRRTLSEFVAKGPTPEQTNFAKQYIIAAFPLMLASNEAIVNTVMRIGFYHLPLDYLDTYRDHIRAVTAAQIKGTFQKNVKPANMILVTVG